MQLSAISNLIYDGDAAISLSGSWYTVAVKADRLQLRNLDFALSVRHGSSLCENAADVAAGRRFPVDSGQILLQYPSGCDGFEDCLATPDIEDPGQVVGQYMKRHFG